MSRWVTERFDRVARTDDLHIAPLRDNGVTCGTLTWIWPASSTTVGRRASARSCATEFR